MSSAHGATGKILCFLDTFYSFKEVNKATAPTAELNELYCKFGQCSFTTDSLCTMERHVDKHLAAKAIKCSLCERRFGKWGPATKHVSKHAKFVDERIGLKKKCPHKGCEYTIKGLQGAVSHMMNQHRYASAKLDVTTNNCFVYRSKNLATILLSHC